jgi:hypothetical protein
MIISIEQFPDKNAYCEAMEDHAETIKSYALTMVESLDWSTSDIVTLDEIDRFLKFAEGSIRKARRIIKNEQESREANRKRQIQKEKERINKNAHD